MGLAILITFALAVILVFAGQQLGSSRVAAAGFLCLGLTAILSGIEVIRTKQALFLPLGKQSLRRRAESYTGLAAQLWGVFFLLAGLGASLAALAAIANPTWAGAFLDRLFDTPVGWGLLLAVLGVFLSLYGLTRVLAGAAFMQGTTAGRLVDLSYRGLGGLSLLVGLGLAGLGVVLILAPGLFLSLLERVFQVSP